jgi:signal transduction histidine kinase
MQNLPPRSGVLVIALFTPLTLVPLAILYGIFPAVFMSMIYLAANALFGSYSLASLRSEQAQVRNQELARKLQETNLQLQASARQKQELATARERNRLARDLHDSVTQTVFSMTLSNQAAVVLLDKDPARVEAQLNRLNELAQSALAELQVLISELRPASGSQADLEAILRTHLANRRFPEGMKVTLESTGVLPLGPAERHGLFRIVQEALNNIEKHSGASRVVIRLAGSDPIRVEVEDNGKGFNPETARRHGGVGLSGMAERAEEIDWKLSIDSTPGAGAKIRVEKAPGQAATGFQGGD